MLETLLALVVAHVLADFVLQTRWILAHKRRWTGFGLHILIVAVTALAFTGSLDPAPLAVIVVSHALIDWAKLAWTDRGPTPEDKARRDGFWPFLIDQMAHLAVIGAVVAVWPTMVGHGWWGGLPAEQQLFVYRTMAVVGGVALSVTAGGVVIDKLLAGFGPHRTAQAVPTVPAPVAHMTGEGLGLPGGGQAIGWLERAVALLLILIGQPEGVGLLLAAKSILRFSDAQARANTEYVIIGTLLSFGWAITSAVVTQAALQHWS